MYKLVNHKTENRIKATIRANFQRFIDTFKITDETSSFVILFPTYKSEAFLQLRSACPRKIDYLGHIVMLELFF